MEPTFWVWLAAQGGQLITNWLQGWSQAEAKKTLATETEAEEERLAGKAKGIQDVEWGWRKEDILKGGAEAIKGIEENAGFMYWSGLKEEKQKEIADNMAKTISRTEESTRLRREFETDVQKTQFKLDYTRPLELGLTDQGGYEISKSLFSMLGTGAQWYEQSQNIQSLKDLLKKPVTKEPAFIPYEGKNPPRYEDKYYHPPTED